MNFEQIFLEELEELAARRGLQTERRDDVELAPDVAAPRDRLVGLCFSGGGIRSATFNLGVVRGLHRWGLLEQIDYLSTVSGGGYTGSCVANYLRTGEGEQLLAPRDAVLGEPDGVTRLRSYGRFATPTGSLGEWLQVATAVGRGVLWNVAGVAALALALAALCSLGLDASGAWRFAFPHGSATVLCLGFAALVVMATAFSRDTPSTRLLVGLVGVTVGVVMLEVIPPALALLEDHSFELAGMVSGSTFVGIGVSGTLTKVPRSLYLPLARLAALLLAVVVPFGLFLLALEHFVSGSEHAHLERAGALALVLVFVFVDFNRTSLHGLYRERVGAAFLRDQPPRMSEFVGRPGPLHLVNVALNVPAEEQLELRDRNVDFFTLSCLHVGGPRTGYARTQALEQAKPGFTLASAVAISGAAAAPNMGTYTDGMLRPLLTLLNARMGYWAPHPAELTDPGRDFVPRLGCLLREFSGSISASGKLVNISDGGHLENLGAYELLRRRCKLIIIGDGEGGHGFSSLAALIRFARVDLNAELDLDLDDLRCDERGLSAKHAAVGTVRYADGSIGRILYLKSSLTGREPPDVRYYKDKHPDFPHESTADQWFDDAQFDAYLTLGEEVVDSLFLHLGYTEPEQLDAERFSLEQQLAKLAVVLAPSSRSRSSSLTQHLENVQETLLREEFADYRSQLIPTRYAREIPAARLHTLVPVVMLQLQLMEHAVEQLGLVDARNREALANRGWMNTFRRWAHSDAFQRVALICVPSFGAMLTQFFDVGLRLGNRYVWSEHPDGGRYPDVLVLGEQNPQLASDEPNTRMITGLARYERADDDQLVIKRIALRAGFEGSDRLEGAVAALRERYASVGVRLEGEAAALVRRLPGDAYEHTPRAIDWGPRDESIISALRVSARRTPDPRDEGRGDDEHASQEPLLAMDFGVPVDGEP